ncbi:MAG: hypothetical protein LBK67_02480 [Coriobacteriales bacterium]|jgi:hypothetical protein|nr:hypothetical protein [Coriobacteriales bacterium]
MKENNVRQLSALPNTCSSAQSSALSYTKCPAHPLAVLDFTLVPAATRNQNQNIGFSLAFFFVQRLKGSLPANLEFLQENRTFARYFAEIHRISLVYRADLVYFRH